MGLLSAPCALAGLQYSAGLSVGIEKQVVWGAKVAGLQLEWVELIFLPIERNGRSIKPSEAELGGYPTDSLILQSVNNPDIR